MPEICRFYGLTIYMFFNDHLPPHFKVKFAEFEANIKILDGSILTGNLPKNKHKLVQAWAEIHTFELITMWDSKSFHSIKPLQ